MNKNRRGVLFAILLLGMFFVACESARATTATFDVTEDTFINEAYPDNNYGGAGSIVVSNEPIDRYGFLQFEDVSLPEDAVVDDVKFKFYVYNHSLNEDGWVRIGLVGGSSWEEDEPTWNGPYPGPLMSAGNFTEINLDLSTGWKEIDVEDFVNKWISEEKDQRGLYIYPSGSDDFTLSLRSKEHGSNQAVIEVEYHVEEEEYDFGLQSPWDENIVDEKRPTFEWTEIDEDSDVDDYLLIVNKLIDDGDNIEEVVDEKISEDETEYQMEEDLEEGEYRWYVAALRDDESTIFRTENWEFSVEFSGAEDGASGDENEDGTGSDSTIEGGFTLGDLTSTSESDEQNGSAQGEADEEGKRGIFKWDNLVFLVVGAVAAVLAYFIAQEVKKRKKNKEKSKGKAEKKKKENEKSKEQVNSKS